MFIIITSIILVAIKYFCLLLIIIIPNINQTKLPAVMIIPQVTMGKNQYNFCLFTPYPCPSLLPKIKTTTTSTSPPAFSIKVSINNETNTKMESTTTVVSILLYSNPTRKRISSNNNGKKRNKRKENRLLEINSLFSFSLSSLSTIKEASAAKRYTSGNAHYKLITLNSVSSFLYQPSPSR